MDRAGPVIRVGAPGGGSTGLGSVVWRGVAVAAIIAGVELGMMTCLKVAAVVDV